MRRKHLPKISAVGLFSGDKFEETPKQKVINMSKLNEFYFKSQGPKKNVFCNVFVIMVPLLHTLY